MNLRQAYTPAEVAAMLGISVSTVYRYVECGKLPALTREEGEDVRGDALRIPIGEFHRAYPGIRSPLLVYVEFEGRPLGVLMRDNASVATRGDGAPSRALTAIRCAPLTDSVTAQTASSRPRQLDRQGLPPASSGAPWPCARCGSAAAYGL